MMLSTSLTMWFFLPIVLAGNTAGNDYGNGNTAGHGNGDGNTAGDGNTEREVITERTHLLIDEAMNISRRVRSAMTYFDPQEFVRRVRRRFAASAGAQSSGSRHLEQSNSEGALSNSEGAAVDSTGSPTVQVNRVQAVDSSGSPTVQVSRVQAGDSFPPSSEFRFSRSSGSPTLLDALIRATVLEVLPTPTDSEDEPFNDSQRPQTPRWQNDSGRALTPLEEQQADAQHNETISLGCSADRMFSTGSPTLG